MNSPPLVENEGKRLVARGERRERERERESEREAESETGERERMTTMARGDGRAQGNPETGWCIRWGRNADAWPEARVCEALRTSTRRPTGSAIHAALSLSSAFPSWFAVLLFGNADTFLNKQYSPGKKSSAAAGVWQKKKKEKKWSRRQLRRQIGDARFYSVSSHNRDPRLSPVALIALRSTDNDRIATHDATIALLFVRCVEN